MSDTPKRPTIEPSDVVGLRWFYYANALEAENAALRESAKAAERETWERALEIVHNERVPPNLIEYRNNLQAAIRAAMEAINEQG